MALNFLQILKLLPKTNCKECGRPTCQAFALDLSKGKVELQLCPHVSEEAKAALAGASAPPIRLVRIGAGETAREIGQETKLFRHEEKFYRPTLLAPLVKDTDADLAARLGKIKTLAFERVGQKLALDLVAVEAAAGDKAKFAAAVKQAAQAGKPLVLVARDPGLLAAGLEAAGKESRPLLCGACAANLEAAAKLAAGAKAPLVVGGKDLEELADLAAKAKAAGAEDLVLDSGARDPARVVRDQTTIRRAALRKKFAPLGYPTIAFTASDDPAEEASRALIYLAKYAGIVVLRTLEPWALLPLLAARQNIYTDPQKPIQVEAKLYAVGQAGPESPVLFTTNFSLTYYSVEGDVEASRVPAWVLVVNTEGTSVLTAYSGDKLNALKVAQAIKATGLEEKVKHRKLIIPGLVAVMSGKLEEASGWEILVGPRESSYIPKYLKTQWKAN